MESSEMWSKHFVQRLCKLGSPDGEIIKNWVLEHLLEDFCYSVCRITGVVRSNHL